MLKKETTPECKLLIIVLWGWWTTSTKLCRSAGLQSSKVKIVGKLQSNSMSISDRCNTFSQAHPIAKGKPFIRSRQAIYVQMLSSNNSLLNKLYHCSLSQRYVLPNYLLIRFLPIHCHSERVIASL